MKMILSIATMGFGLLSVSFLPALAAPPALVSTNAVTADSIVRDAGYADVKTPILLAFLAEVDNRPLYVEDALLAMELTNHNWRLANVYRHPKERADFRHWMVATVTDTPYTGKQDYDHRPTEADVEKFLKDTWWEFRASRNFRLLRGEVYSDNWKRAFGYQPNHEFSTFAANIPRANEVVQYERESPVFQSKIILRDRGDALLSALDGGRQIQEPSAPPPGMVVDPVPAHYWLNIALTNGSVYRLGISSQGDLMYVAVGGDDGCRCGDRYDVTDAAKGKVARVMRQLDQDLRQEIVSAPLPLVYAVGTVDDGGTLSGIARMFYGDASKWRKIYEANRKTIKNPNAIGGGLKLTIPKLQ